MITETNDALALYLYGFTLPNASVPPLLGVDDSHPVHVHQLDGVNAVLSAVALADFVGEQGERNVQDVAWLTPRACRHALVIDRLAEQGPVYPLSFGTLFSGTGALEREITRRSSKVLAALWHITGCQEWSLEATLDRKQAVEALLAEGLRAGRFCLPDAAGRRHLEEQKLRRSIEAGLNDWLRQHFSAWQNKLQPLARNFRPRRIVDDKVLHWAYLLPEENVSAFQQQIAEIEGRYRGYGFTFRITGPWAAYSFCQLDES